MRDHTVAAISPSSTTGSQAPAASTVHSFFQLTANRQNAIHRRRAMTTLSHGCTSHLAFVRVWRRANVTPTIGVLPKFVNDVLSPGVHWRLRVATAAWNR